MFLWWTLKLDAEFVKPLHKLVRYLWWPSKVL